jgi:hypothetical protein
LGISVSETSFKIRPKGKWDLERALACSFEQIVRRHKVGREHVEVDPARNHAQSSARVRPLAARDKTAVVETGSPAEAAGGT